MPQVASSSRPVSVDPVKCAFTAAQNASPPAPPGDTGVLSILNPLNILNIVRSIWNIIFGVLMIFLQLNWKQMINRNFGFLNHWFLRGCFYIFVGTNVMTTDESAGAFNIMFSFVAGFPSCFVGGVELLFGFKCAAEGDVERGGDNKAKGGGGMETNQVDPTLNINLTPNQLAQGATWAAHNAGTVAAVGGAVAGAAAASGGGGGGQAANPFFGNNHLNK